MADFDFHAKNVYITRHYLRGPVNVRMRKALFRCVTLILVTLFHPGQFISFRKGPRFFGGGEIRRVVEVDRV